MLTNIIDMKEQFVYDPLISKRQQYLLATQVCHALFLLVYPPCLLTLRSGYYSLCVRSSKSTTSSPQERPTSRLRAKRIVVAYVRRKTKSGTPIIINSFHKQIDFSDSVQRLLTSYSEALTSTNVLERVAGSLPIARLLAECLGQGSSSKLARSSGVSLL